MLTSMFRKTLVVYMSVIVLAFGALTFTLRLEIEHFLAGQRLQVLNQEAKALLPILERVNGNPNSYPVFHDVVSRYKQVDNTTVNLLLVRDSGLKRVQRLTDRLVSHSDILNVSAVQRVLNGQPIQLMGPFKKGIRESTLTVGLPIFSNGEVIGALFLHTPMQELEMGQVTQIILLLAIPILFVSIAVLYFISRRFSRPLVQMNRTVQLIGQGHFQERLDVNSRDEVGQLAQAFNDMAAQLERLETMRKDLIANVSHEIRTPLTSVRGFIQGILEGVIPVEQQHRYLETAYQELNRLNTILNTMLDLSAIETGRIAIDFKPVLWAPVVEDVLQRVKVRAAEKGIHLQACSSDESVTVWGDAQRLTQVLFNIVDNAIRHTEHGEIRISSVAQDGRLNVQIRDTGEGIPEEMLPYIWERFFTGSASRSSNQERSGLGLTIVKYLVTKMNGHIDVESAPSRGTTFTLTFPIFSSSTYS